MSGVVKIVVSPQEEFNQLDEILDSSPRAACAARALIEPMPASTPQEIHSLFERAFNNADVEAILALYEPGAVLVAGGQQVTGHDAIRNAFQRSLSTGARMTLDTRAVIESGEGLAVLHGAWSLGPPVGMQGLSTEVVRRQPDGSWKFVIDSPNTLR